VQPAGADSEHHDQNDQAAGSWGPSYVQGRITSSITAFEFSTNPSVCLLGGGDALSLEVSECLGLQDQFCPGCGLSLGCGRRPTSLASLRAALRRGGLAARAPLPLSSAGRPSATRSEPASRNGWQCRSADIGGVESRGRQHSRATFGGLLGGPAQSKPTLGITVSAPLSCARNKDRTKVSGSVDSIALYNAVHSMALIL
jgi:hypothetical protein